MQARMIVVRHGERVDEAGTAEAAAWELQCRQQAGHPHRMCDPPITAAGHQQAKACAAVVRAHLDWTLGPSPAPVLIVWCSPLLRCLQTADTLIQTMVREHGVPAEAVRLQPLPGLAECAAAVRRIGLARFRFLSDEEIRAVCASPVAATAPVSDASRSFDDAVEELAQAHAGQAFLVVSHREGIRDLKLRLRGELSRREATRTPGYCAVAVFDYHLHAKRWSFILQQETHGREEVPTDGGSA
jgi:broad specificity phosphatase PhoE